MYYAQSRPYGLGVKNLGPRDGRLLNNIVYRFDTEKERDVLVTTVNGDDLYAISEDEVRAIEKRYRWKQDALVGDFLPFIDDYQ